jgi:hypothetical protein
MTRVISEEGVLRLMEAVYDDFLSHKTTSAEALNQVFSFGLWPLDDEEGSDWWRFVMMLAGMERKDD